MRVDMGAGRYGVVGRGHAGRYRTCLRWVVGKGVYGRFVEGKAYMGWLLREGPYMGDSSRAGVERAHIGRFVEGRMERAPYRAVWKGCLEGPYMGGLWRVAW